MKMTALKYIRESGVANTSEILALKREDPKGFATLTQMAEEEMLANGIEIEQLVHAQAA